MAMCTRLKMCLDELNADSVKEQFEEIGEEIKKTFILLNHLAQRYKYILKHIVFIHYNKAYVYMYILGL